MRLINTGTLTLEDFLNKPTPPYAILSHTWGDDEVTFQDLLNLPPDDKDKRWTKITQTCRLAREHGLDYAWIDTCCIDKSSSAELTESINSMYRWYEAANLCVVHLFDLADSGKLTNELGSCRWATRGWTLQEIIAPKKVKFYNAEWNYCGSKGENSEDIATHLKLQPEILNGSASIFDYSISQRMAWAAQRSTTRPEDVAYCLLGIMDVSIPLIYGEGPKAFRRLQQAILGQSNDLTILAWQWTGEEEDQQLRRRPHSGLLASSPRQFKESSAVRASKGDFLEFTLTNKGLLVRGDLMLRSLRDRKKGTERYSLRLGWRGPSRSAGEFQIALRRIGPNMFCRDQTRENEHSGHCTFFYLEEFYLLEEPPTSAVARSLTQQYRSRSIHVSRNTKGFRMYDVRPRRPWDSQDNLFLRPKGNYSSGFPNVLALLFVGGACPSGDHEGAAIVLCDQRTQEPKLYIFNSSKHPDLMKVVFGDSTRQYSLHWEDLLRQVPGLENHGETAPFRIHGQDVRIRAELHRRKLVINEERDEVDVFSLKFNIVDQEKTLLRVPCSLLDTKEPPPILIIQSNNITR